MTLVKINQEGVDLDHVDLLSRMSGFTVRDNAKYGEWPQIRNEETSLVKWHRREEVVGKEIIDGVAKKVGNVKDLAWSNDGKLAIVVERGREEESYLPFDQVEKIGDVVFIKGSSGLESVPMKTCPVCKHKNLLDAKFCQRCGKTLEEKK